MDILKELEEFMDDDNNEDLEMIVSYAKKVMEELGKEAFDEEVYAKVARMFGDEFVAEHMEEIIQSLGVEDKQNYNVA